MILCDTNILVDFYKNNDEVINELQQIGVANLSVSIVTVGELYFGAKDKRELLKIKKHLSALNQFPIDHEISETALSLLENYTLSHHLSLPDAIIAATALRHKLSLYTLNIKDFRFIDGIYLHKP